MPYRDNGTYYADCDVCDRTAEAGTHDAPSPTYADRMEAWWEAGGGGDPAT